MSTELATTNGLGQETINKLVLQHDLSSLNEKELVSYYIAVCNEYGLDYKQKPFDILTLQQKKTLYANKNCSAQLTVKHKPTVIVVDRNIIGGMIIVTARVTKQDGSSVEDVGVVPMPANGADAQANAIMKAVTKAKRRTLLSAFGLGMMDETEIETTNAEVIDITPMLNDNNEELQTKITDLKLALVNVTTVEQLDAIRLVLKESEQAVRDAVGQSFTDACDALGVVFKKGAFVSKVTA